MQQTAERERLQREVVRSTRRAFEIAETRLREGTVDLVTVLNTQQTLFQAQDMLAQARLARLQAVVGLFQALGGGWQKPPEDDRPSIAVNLVRPAAHEICVMCCELAGRAVIYEGGSILAGWRWRADDVRSRRPSLPWS